jgi:hypothetical protein
MKGKKRFSKEGLHFFVIRATPKERKGRLRNIQGAYVSCWIDFWLHEGALHLAKFYIKQNGWKPSAVTEHLWINGPNEVASQKKRYYREAKKDGASFVFNMYAKNT